jgi:hypothetical protein
MNMNKLAVIATGAAVLALAGVGIAVNSAALSAVPESDIGQAPQLIMPTTDATPAPSTTADPTPSPSSGDDHGGSSGSGSNSGSGSGSSGGGSDDSGGDDHGGDDGGGHGSDD